MGKHSSLSHHRLRCFLLACGDSTPFSPTALFQPQRVSLSSASMGGGERYRASMRRFVGKQLVPKKHSPGLASARVLSARGEGVDEPPAEEGRLALARAVTLGTRTRGALLGPRLPPSYLGFPSPASSPLPPRSILDRIGRLNLVTLKRFLFQ